MSREEWDELGAKGRRSLYDQYQQEIRATDEYFARFASAVLAVASSQYSTPLSPFPAESDAAQLLRRYIGASRLLRHVRAFLHVPAYRVDELGWGETWRNITFHRYACIEPGWGHDPYYDAIQLFAALAFSRFPSEVVAVQSLTLTTQGYAFWTVPHLTQLIYWMRESPENRANLTLNIHSYVESAVMSDDGEHVLEQVESLTRALIATEQFFVSLVRLECRVDTLWNDGGHHKTQTMALEVARCVRGAKGLEWLSLAFGEDVHWEGDPSYYFRNHSRRSMASIAATSYNLLGAVAGLKHLRHLHLSLHTAASHLLGVFRVISQLSSLRLSHMALLSGSWDDVLEWVADHLTLSRVELNVLEDNVQSQSRILLDPRIPAWRATIVPETWYNEYEKDIRCFVLRTSANPLVLCPDEYIAGRLDLQCRDPSPAYPTAPSPSPPLLTGISP
jgi:hypothetical protein